MTVPLDAARTEVKTRPLLLVGPDLKSDALFFGGIGVLCGIAQLVGFSYSKSQLGSELLQEHIAFRSLGLVFLLLVLLRGATTWYEKKYSKRCSRLDAFMGHLEARLIALASVASMATLGFALVAACSQSYYYAAVIAIFGVYLISIAEVAANAGSRLGQSRLFHFAFGMVIFTPFSPWLR